MFRLKFGQISNSVGLVLSTINAIRSDLMAAQTGPVTVFRCIVCQLLAYVV